MPTIAPFRRWPARRRCAVIAQECAQPTCRATVYDVRRGDRDALLDVSIPTLMLSLVHMSGDPELIRGALKPAGLFLNEVQGYMSEEDKAEVRAIALEVIRDYRDRGCPEPDAGRPGAAARDDGVARLRAGARRVRADAARGDGARRRRRPGAPAAADSRTRARTRSPSSSSVAASRACSPASGSRRPASRSPSSRRTPASAAPGGRTRYPGARVDVGNHFYCYSFEPSDQWTRVLRRAARAAGVLRGRDGQARHRAARPVGDRGARRRAGTTRPRPGRCACAAATAPSRRWPPGAVISAVGQLNRPSIPDIPGQDDFAGAVLPLRAVGPRGRPARQARRDDRRGRERLPDRADHRRRGRAPHGVPAHRAVDVPEPELPRRGRAGRAVGAAASAVLRPLVPLPAVLARLRQGARRRRGSTRTTPISSARSAR